jgi:hypothetical protein
MNVHTSFPAEPDDRAQARREALRDRQLDRLDRLAEMGMALAEAICRQGLAEADEAPAERRLAALNAAAMAYARAARVVRLTLALQSRLAEASDAADKQPDGPISYSVRWVDDNTVPRARQRARVEGLVKHVAEGAAMDAERAERLAAEAAEKLKDEDLYADLLDRPISEILARICHDLGLDPDWDGLAQEPWAQEEIASGAPGWPLWAAGRADAAPPPSQAWTEAGRQPASG